MLSDDEKKMLKDLLEWFYVEEVHARDCGLHYPYDLGGPYPCDCESPSKQRLIRLALDGDLEE